MGRNTIIITMIICRHFDFEFDFDWEISIIILYKRAFKNYVRRTK